MSTRHAKLRIGIVGAGNIVKHRHLPGLKAIEDAEVVAVCNSSYESSEEFCNQYLPEAKPYASWAELLGEPDIDIVWIGTHPYLHSTIAVSALEAGKHVFCQARMAANLTEAEEMVAAAQRNPHLVTMVCPAPIGLKGSLLMQKLLAEGYVGLPHHLRLNSFTSSYLDPEAPPHWRQRDELSGLNVLTLGIYAEVVQRWFGPVNRVFAHRKTINPIRAGYEVRVPDMVTILCQFASGMEGVLEFSGIAPFAPTDRLEVYGDQGTLRYDFERDEITGGRVGDPSARQIAIPPGMAQEWTVERDFIAAVCSPATIVPQPSFVEGFQYMKVVQAVADSITDRKEITIQ